MSLLNFDEWQKLNEITTVPVQAQVKVKAPVKFDPLARYMDPTFGLPRGKVDSGLVVLGGTNNVWGGSMARALAFGAVANEFMGKNVISIQKRTKETSIGAAVTGTSSDHNMRNLTAYAIDIRCTSIPEGDKILKRLMFWFGQPQYKGGSWLNVVKEGYRYQIGWKVKGHFDKIHIGVRFAKDDVVSTGSNSAYAATRGMVTKMPGVSFEEKIANNPDFKEWYRMYAPPGSKSPGVNFIRNYLIKNPTHKEWFIKKFDLNAAGDKLNYETDNAADSYVISKKEELVKSALLPKAEAIAEPKKPAKETEKPLKTKLVKTLPKAVKTVKKQAKSQKK